jgi:hypothetical protein
MLLQIYGNSLPQEAKTKRKKKINQLNQIHCKITIIKHKIVKLALSNRHGVQAIIAACQNGIAV